jgi:hypothetical protein
MTEIKASRLKPGKGKNNRPHYIVYPTSIMWGNEATSTIAILPVGIIPLWGFT